MEEYYFSNQVGSRMHKQMLLTTNAAKSSNAFIKLGADELSKWCFEQFAPVYIVQNWDNLEIDSLTTIFFYLKSEYGIFASSSSRLLNKFLSLLFHLKSLQLHHHKWSDQTSRWNAGKLKDIIFQFQSFQTVVL